MHAPFDAATIIFALLAAFVVWKLRSVLGTRTGLEKRPDDRPQSESAGESNVFRLPGAAAPRDETPAAPRRFDAAVRSDTARNGVDQVIAADPSFDPGRFVEGAKSAYDMIVTAFAKGDRETLSKLVSGDVLASFASVIDERAQKGEKASTRLVSVDDTEVTEAWVKDGVAHVSLRFVAKLINVVEGSNGAIVSGDPERISATEDTWTFSRNTKTRDPNWTLIATESAH